MPSGRRLAAPPKWTDEELRAGRDRREVAFRQTWREEGPGAVAAVVAELRAPLEQVFVATNDLREVTGQVFRDDPSCWQLLRYVCAPVLSEENFWTLVDSPKSSVVRPQYADDAAEVISLVVDPIRFPWVEANRDPQPGERNAALLATLSLLAAQRVGTKSRSLSSARQENAVKAVLAGAGYELDENRTRVNLLDDMARGMYSPERRVAGAKCDVPVRLKDGRLLAIECKVSMGPKNGWKRMNREIGGKAETWRNHFGATGSVITAAVIDGVFDLGCLTQAQNRQGVVIFWEHDLGPLSQFLDAAQ